MNCLSEFEFQIVISKLNNLLLNQQLLLRLIDTNQTYFWQCFAE